MIIFWTTKASLRLTKIYNYCFTEFGTAVALRFMKGIDNDMRLLSRHPYIGKMEEVRYNSHRIRSLVEGYYKILYNVDEANDTIYILSLFDCRQHPSRMEEELN